jgi:hypothetical protein
VRRLDIRLPDPPGVVRATVFGLLAWAMAASALSGQTLQGRLLDSGTGRPLPGATMTLLDEDGARLAATQTDSAGSFGLSAARAGAFQLRAERLGYRTATAPAMELGAGDTLRVEFRLSAEAVLLSPVVVTGQPRRLTGALGDFRERAERRAWGSFVTREEIGRRNPVHTTNLLRTVAGVRLVPTRSGRHAVLLRGGCPARVYLDGIRVRLAGTTIDDLVRPQELEGIEVYGSEAGVPAQYGGLGGGGCGAVLLWTRRGDGQW